MFTLFHARSLSQRKKMNRFLRHFHSLHIWVILFITLIVLAIIYYVSADRYTPYTSDAYIQAAVVQMAPR